MPSPSYLPASDESWQRFELLSAYLDGEVNLAQRQQVQQWLDTEPQFKELYLSLLRLEREIEQLPIAASALSANQISQQVFEQIAQENRRYRWLFGTGLVLTALLAAVVSPGLWKMLNPPEMHMAKNLNLSEPLVVSLNTPLFNLGEGEENRP
jgi:anti-sigma factor RsiW